MRALADSDNELLAQLLAIPGDIDVKECGGDEDGYWFCTITRRRSRETSELYLARLNIPQDPAQRQAARDLFEERVNEIRQLIALGKAGPANLWN